ncbi:putative phosphoglycerate mutase [Nonomuraea fuscirosea]|uniref:Putative phosphoglycerate mutase n=1 Tax=Nonomuraea fuscirosea TaxID=1291556 RepID=A0A2T0MZQ1_9ACTN|nr:histidine phosphatase family protein [Nonomuraea fuscirosea]PRX64865.1 putative phosphoglycerate mutase [Nonomuraea fuscirosea]
MTGRVRLVLVRHGESVWNVEERYQGQSDSGLTATGREQAEVAAAALLARFGPPDLVVASDLPRARDTANAYLRHFDLEARLDARLREADIGSWAGRPFTEIAAEYPDVLAAVGRGEDVRRGGGETFAELRRRVWQALVDAAALAAGDVAGDATVMVFTHGGPIRVAAAAALRLPVPGHLSFAPPVNTSLTVIGYAGERRNHSVVEYNAPTTWAAQAARAD